MDFLKSKARTDSGALAIVHHGTRDFRFPVSKMAPLSHFGTRAAARERLFDWPEARLISGLLDIRNPLFLPDINGLHDPEPFARLILSREDARARLPDDFLERVLAAEQDAGEGQEEIVKQLQEAGFDGIGYRNHHEDPGSMSWVIFSSEQLHVLRDGRAGDSLDPWEYDEESFIGSSIIRDVFEIDGRDASFDHIWEMMESFSEELPDIAKDERGWTARWLGEDWEPRASLGLFDPDGTARGFYLQGQLWIDEDARGSGKSTLLIQAAADLTGERPTGEHQGLGMSPAGYAAHISALRKIKEAASEMGYLDLEAMEP